MIADSQFVGHPHRARLLLLVSAVPGLVIMSRALPPNWREVGLTLHGAGTVQILMIASGLFVLFAGLFLCRSLLPPAAGSEGRPVSRSKRFSFALITCFLMVLVTAGATEVVLRAIGQRPYAPPRFTAASRAGSGLFKEHPVLGYTHVPGESRFELTDGHSFVATHLPNTLRVTRPPDSAKNAMELPQVWIFGCSLTHGWSVTDDQTFPWLLDQTRPDLKVVNFGVTGYGTVQSLLKLREALQAGCRPAVVVLAYASLHDERNTFQRSWQKVAGVFPQPYARFADRDTLQFEFGRPRFQEWFGMRISALVHAAEKYFNQREAARLKSHDVSKEIVRRFARTCEAEGISWVLAGMDQEPLTREMVSFVARQGWQALDMSVDVKKAENNNKPIDAHPSAVAHAAYAKTLNEFLFVKVFSGGANGDVRHAVRPITWPESAVRRSSTVATGSTSSP